MPKESKKFINPLLRPSQQEVEPKQETAPRQEKSTPATRVQSGKTQTASQPGEQDETSKKMSPASNTPAPSAATRPSPTNTRATRDTQDIQLAETISIHEAKPTYKERDPEDTGPTTDIKRAEAERTGRVDRQENSAAGAEHSGNRTQIHEPQAETQRPRTDVTILRPEVASYDPHVSSSTIAEDISEPAESEYADESDDEPYAGNFALTSKAKRKRGEQAFEKTHVRFTVWVDKTLKQSFEDIAFQRDKPKTTLLNEAIADLVRKYEA
ncbi:MAG: hypothetical protein PVS3B1_23930 [Ktedonobacteraceae bacterium]